MKRLVPILLTASAFIACKKNPDTDKLDSNYLVYTNYDKKTDFKQFSTYYIPDSVLVIGDKKDPEYWKSEAAAVIINAYRNNLSSKGFTYTDSKDAADLGMQISYVQSAYYFIDYGQPEWWRNYPGYWDAPYWGNWGGWHYPYVMNCSTITNLFLTRIMNLKAPEGDNQKLPVLWSSFLSGSAGYSDKVNQTLVVCATNQPLAQSPYLTNK